MFLFDSINQIYLENKTIINFLSRPIIYLNINKEEEKEKEIEKIEKLKELDKLEEKIIEKEFYKYSYKLDIENLINRIKNLAKKPNKSD